MAKLYFRYGTMGSGKSIDLLKASYNYKERGKKPLLITSTIDNRYGSCKITTRIGISEKAYAFSKEDNIYEYISSIRNDVDVVLADEAQFFSREQIQQLSDIVDILDIPVICYGLRSDFQNKLFPGSHELLAIADKIEEMKTMCECGKKATCNLRIINGDIVTEGKQIFIGGNESYLPVCRKCYKKYVTMPNSF